MYIGMLQPNPLCGDLEANASQLADLTRRAFSRIRQHIKLGESTFADWLFLTPSYALTGVPWQPLATVDGFFKRARNAVDDMARQLPHSAAVLVNIPMPEGQRFFLARRGAVEEIPCVDNGRLSVHGMTLYLPEADGKSQCSKTGYSRPLRGTVDLVAFLEPLRFHGSAQFQREEAGEGIARAWKLPVLFANHCGATDGDLYAGQSCVFAPGGHLAARAKAFDTDVVLLSLTEDLTVFSHPAVHPALQWEEAVFEAAVMGVRDYVRKCGLKGVVLGLSGGMDSALVACIATDAVGPKNVHALLMPSPYSSDHSVTDALTLAKNLGISYQEAPIHDIMDGFDGVLEPLLQPFPRREGDTGPENLQARIRGVILMAFANRLDRAVLGTGNKSENAVGYCTLYGDTVGAIEPIGDIYKTDVYKIARWYNSAFGGRIPEHILTKAPSAELRPGQTDQDSLPPYEILDKILRAVLENGSDPATLEVAGADKETVSRILRLLAVSEFKRHQTPPALRMTRHTLGADWVMPVAARVLPPRS